MLLITDVAEKRKAFCFARGKKKPTSSLSPLQLEQLEQVEEKKKCYNVVGRLALTYDLSLIINSTIKAKGKEGQRKKKD